MGLLATLRLCDCILGMALTLLGAVACSTITRVYHGVLTFTFTGSVTLLDLDRLDTSTPFPNSKWQKTHQGPLARGVY